MRGNGNARLQGFPYNRPCARRRTLGANPETALPTVTVTRKE